MLFRMGARTFASLSLTAVVACSAMGSVALASESATVEPSGQEVAVPEFFTSGSGDDVAGVLIDESSLLTPDSAAPSDMPGDVSEGSVATPEDTASSGDLVAEPPAGGAGNSGDVIPPQGDPAAPEDAPASEGTGEFGTDEAPASGTDAAPGDDVPPVENDAALDEAAPDVPDIDAGAAEGATEPGIEEGVPADPKPSSPTAPEASAPETDPSPEGGQDPDVSSPDVAVDSSADKGEADSGVASAPEEDTADKATAQTGWVVDKQTGKRYYYGEDGQKASGELKIDGKWYYFDPTSDNAMTTGFARVAVSSGSGSFKVTYYGKDGVRVSGSRTIDGDSYYFDKTTGAMTTGFLRDPSGKGYSFHALDDGRKLTGEQPLHGGWRDFGADGFMEVGFGTAEQGGPSRKVYYDEYDGARASGETNVKGSWYYFNPTNGAMATGLTEVTTQQGGVKTALYGSDGKRKYGEQYLNGGWYYFDEADGHMLTGWKWLNNGDRMVYYGADGRMLHGTHVIDGYRRVFDNETGAVNKYGYQNPLGYYQVSTWNVWVPNYSGNPAFSYVSPSQIGLAADRWDCIETFISRAYDYMYTPYVWDYALAPGVGIDCAGLVMQALYATG
ncbi:MAG: hypothetical protein KHY83_05610, partial [Coriobacteriia bacterium]|nr:hypothetical protein [Coriobacteriia bacterium]